MKPLTVLIGATATVAVLGGCCGDGVTNGLAVEVVDAATGEPLGAGTTVAARSGAYADTARQVVGRPGAAPGIHLLVWGRAGVYTVTAERAGYQAWRREDVRVRDRLCGVHTTHITAALVRLPARIVPQASAGAPAAERGVAADVGASEVAAAPPHRLISPRS